MKQILMKAFGLVMIAGALTATSCKKGDAGPQGEKGDSAIANVYYSPWISLTEDQWGLSSDSTIIYSEIENAKIDTAVLNKGAVHVYWNASTSDDPVIYSLPYVGSAFNIGFVAYVGGIEVYTNDVYYGRPVTDILGDGQGQYRYIIIPGGVKIARSSINWNNYNEVKAALNIKD